jgi:uncharacterized protein (TIGR01777 family)
MNILIAGASGFIGSALVQFLRGKGYKVARLVRSKDKLSEDAIFWDPDQKKVNRGDLEGFDAVINLAGENIKGRWTNSKKERLYKSRVETTRFLAESLEQLEKPPRVLINASAIGFYGNNVKIPTNEKAGSGNDFLAKICKDWELATEKAERAGIRVIHFRMGVVLSKDGGALSTMLIPFKLGLGGKIGEGDQVMSWIALEDLLNAMNHLLIHPEVRGPVNIVAPEAVSNKEFTQTLGKILNRPTFFSVPAFMVHFIFGEMGDSVLLGSTWAVPEVLEANQFVFAYPTLSSALTHILSK